MFKPRKPTGFSQPLRLSPDLADIVGKEEASRAECITMLWAYIKKHKIQDPESKQYFIPDKKMSKVFGDDRIRIRIMAKYLEGHLFKIPLAPIVEETTDY